MSRRSIRRPSHLCTKQNPCGAPPRPQPLPLGAIAAGFGLSLLSGATLAQAPAEAPVTAASSTVSVATPASGPASATPASKATPAGSETQALPDVAVKARADKRPEAKQTYQAVTTTIGKGKQALRDIPQSVTVVTERLMADRRLDTVKEVLHHTAGITFQAAEGGEEDIRLRGFSLQSTGDIFVDGVRDPAFYDRDTFNLDRLELLRGSASMLFGRGSTGGAVNQVSKTPFLANATELKLTGGNHSYVRGTADVNVQTDADAALRITAMKTEANNNGAGSSIDKYGLAGAYRWGVGKPVEHQVSFYHLDNNNGINYGLPWIRPSASSSQADQTINPNLKPSDYFGMGSDYNAGKADFLTYTNLARLGGGTELKTVVRRGAFKRDQRAGTVRHANTTYLSNFSDATVYNRGTQLKIQDMGLTQAQSDLTGRFEWFGLKHDIATGVDLSRERRTVFGAKNAAQGGVTLTKPTTTAGTPDDGAWVDESRRVLGKNNSFVATGAGAYVQDLLQVARHWKLLGGLRYDYMEGKYLTYNLGTGAQTNQYKQSIYKWSKRAGVLFQPNALHSYHFSYGTSFNTSGDTYSYSSASANTPPESSQNLELGAKLDTEDGRLTTRVALFHATKLHERNTDPTNASVLLLSGKRHAAGFDMDVIGMISDDWEIYTSYTWIPIAKVDKAAVLTNGTGGNRTNDRPGLTPRHSGTIWNKYRFTPQIRAGLGVNFRSKQAPADIPSPQNGIYYAPGFGTIDLMAEYTFNQSYSLQANVTNVADKLYADTLYRGHYVPGVGRLVQVTLTAKF